ncbi:MAG: transcriptional regulator [Deltaproteobacteria bacterium]|nr:transcriptional regulator [Deltaproteobacteria bacterium]
MPTDRQRLSALLLKGPFTLQEISQEMGLSTKDVLLHMGHVRKSVRPPRQFVLEPAKCLRCGYVFRDRSRLNPPGRCPKCKSTHIRDPRYGIR